MIQRIHNKTTRFAQYFNSLLLNKIVRQASRRLNMLKFIIIGVITVHLCVLSAAQAEEGYNSANIEASINQNDNTDRLAVAHDQVTQIISSPDYANAKEKNTWERIDKPSEKAPSWLQKFLDQFLELLSNGEDSNDTEVSIIPLVTKMLLILALIVFVIWVFKKASIQAWFKSLKLTFIQKPVITKFNPIKLSQSWESLPNHTLIPKAIKELADNNEIEQAASLLYRGGLRWLNNTQTIGIQPATTEKQCLNQIEQLSTLATYQPSQSSLLNQTLDVSQDFINRSTADYLQQIIHLWIKVAYAPQYKDIQSYGDVPVKMAPSDHNPTQFNQQSLLTETRQQLYDIADTWITSLPLAKQGDSL